MKSMKHNNSGKTWLTDECVRIHVNAILQDYKEELRKGLFNAQLTIDDTCISLCSSAVNKGGLRVWFSCPKCSNRVGILYRQPLTEVIACRKCLKLEYRSRRFKGMLENELPIEKN